MKDKIFVDSNIFLYLFSNDIEKKRISLKILNSYPFISTQVVNENINICIKKFKLSKDKAFRHGMNLLSKCNVIIINDNTIRVAMEVSTKYKFSYFDSLIIASSIECGCNTLFSEDLHHGQLVEKSLKIINPFI
jgi:predicted nucleic acid-binding protein